jgi:ADP-ribosylglycohydrolase
VNIKDAFTALALGDALGVTSEFATLEEVKFTYKMNKSSGWPFKCIGGGPFGFRAYHPSDDTEMAAAIVNSWKQHYGFFDGEQIAANFISWMDSGPRDIGMTTREALTAISKGADWWEGGRAIWEKNPHAWSNGSLMRNAVVSGMGDSIVEIFDHTLQHGMITHWAPLPAICCAAQSWLLNNPEVVDEEDWREHFRDDWRFWMAATEDPLSRVWLGLTIKDQEEAWQIFNDADFDMHSFRPFGEIEHIGFCLTTLQIGVWAMQWAMSDKPYPVEYLPEGFPPEPFQRTGKDVIGWVVMIGRDADTYGATAGPMVAVWGVDEEEVRFLQGLDLIYEGNPIIERNGCYKQISEDWLGLAMLEYNVVSKEDNFSGVFKVITDAHTIIFYEHFAWEGPHTLNFAPIPSAVLRDPSDEEIAEATLRAIKRRQELNFVCNYCDDLCHPWQSNDGVTCHGCTSRYQGVVY